MLARDQKGVWGLLWVPGTAVGWGPQWVLGTTIGWGPQWGPADHERACGTVTLMGPRDYNGVPVTRKPKDYKRGRRQEWGLWTTMGPIDRKLVLGPTMGPKKHKGAQDHNGGLGNKKEPQGPQRA